MCQNPNTKIRIEFWGFGLELTNSQYHWYSLLVPNRNWNGASPSGKATGFGPGIRRFESFRPRPGRIKIFNSRLRNPLKYILIKYTCTSFFFFFRIKKNYFLNRIFFHKLNRIQIIRKWNWMHLWSPQAGNIDHKSLNPKTLDGRFCVCPPLPLSFTFIFKRVS